MGYSILLIMQGQLKMKKITPEKDVAEANSLEKEPNEPKSKISNKDKNKLQDGINKAIKVRSSSSSAENVVYKNKSSPKIMNIKKRMKNLREKKGRAIPEIKAKKHPLRNLRKVPKTFTHTDEIKENKLTKKSNKIEKPAAGKKPEGIFAQPEEASQKRNILSPKKSSKKDHSESPKKVIMEKSRSDGSKHW